MRRRRRRTRARAQRRPHSAPVARGGVAVQRPRGRCRSQVHGRVRGGGRPAERAARDAKVGPGEAPERPGENRLEETRTAALVPRQEQRATNVHREWKHGGDAKRGRGTHALSLTADAVHGPRAHIPRPRAAPQRRARVLRGRQGDVPAVEQPRGDGVPGRRSRDARG